MSLKMRDLPRLTASILFNKNKYYAVAQEAIKLIEERRKNLIAPGSVFIDLESLAKAVDDLADPRNSHTICKVLLPKMNAKLRKLQTEGMFIVGVVYEEANAQPPVDVIEDPYNRYGEFGDFDPPPTEDKPPEE